MKPFIAGLLIWVLTCPLALAQSPEATWTDEDFTDLQQLCETRVLEKLERDGLMPADLNPARFCNCLYFQALARYPSLDALKRAKNDVLERTLILPCTHPQAPTEAQFLPPWQDKDKDDFLDFCWHNLPERALVHLGFDPRTIMNVPQFCICMLKGVSRMHENFDSYLNADDEALNHTLFRHCGDPAINRFKP